jgi:hypothetical protein
MAISEIDHEILILMHKVNGLNSQKLNYYIWSLFGNYKF